MQEEATRRLRFREEIRKHIENNTSRGTAEILRTAVEEIGAALGMAEVEACREFLGFKGSVWDVSTGSMLVSTVRSDKDPPDPARHWSAITDVILLGP
jgi:hypothetical protein